jgi:hypothetical protein
VPDMNTTTYRSMLSHATAALAVDDDPDGLPAQQALLLAAHAGIRRTGASEAANWDMFAAAIAQALADLQADLPDPPILAAGLPSPSPDSGELRRAVIELVGLLANRYATAARGPAGTPWRRLVWASAAHQLDDAAAELR